MQYIRLIKRNKRKRGKTFEQKHNERQVKKLMDSLNALARLITLSYNRKDAVIIYDKAYTIKDLIDIIVKDLDELKEYRAIKDCNTDCNNSDDFNEFIGFMLKENLKLKKFIDILLTRVDISVTDKFKSPMLIINDEIISSITNEEHDLVREVLENEKGQSV